MKRNFKITLTLILTLAMLACLTGCGAVFTSASANNSGGSSTGGDPRGDGFGGSDNKIVGEFKSNGFENNLSHTRGAVSMARSAAPNSASSQFFICHADSPHLDGDYAVFGYVTEGIEVVDAVCETAQPTDGNGTIPPEAQPVMNSVTIRTE